MALKRVRVDDKGGVVGGQKKTKLDWTPAEDAILSENVERNWKGSWKTLLEETGLPYSSKACRLRWVNRHRPGLQTSEFTPDEETRIRCLLDQLGHRWTDIAKHFPGRTDSEVKNFWYRNLRPRLLRGLPCSLPVVHHRAPTVLPSVPPLIRNFDFMLPSLIAEYPELPSFQITPPAVVQGNSHYFDTSSALLSPQLQISTSQLLQPPHVELPSSDKINIANNSSSPPMDQVLADILNNPLQEMPALLWPSKSTPLTEPSLVTEAQIPEPKLEENAGLPSTTETFTVAGDGGGNEIVTADSCWLSDLSIADASNWSSDLDFLSVDEICGVYD